MTNIAIWHGDSRALASHVKGPINCIITDPPYGVAFYSKSAVTPRGRQYTNKIAGDDDIEAAIELFQDVMTTLIRELADEADVYVFTKWTVLNQWITAVNELDDIKVSNCLVWDKGTPGMGDVAGSYGMSHELVIYAKKGRRPVRERRSSIISVDRVSNKGHSHPTEKPVGLIEVFLRQSTEPGDLVVDPFSGSGSTAVAAQNLGRRCIGIEIDDQYARSSRERLTQPSLL